MALKPFKQELIFVPKKCRLPWCPSCGVSYWGKVRARLKPHLHLFRRARLFTLTIDPKNFESGQQAYEIIEKKQQYIKRLLRLIGFKKAFKVLSFHKAKASRPDGNEWPHWHIVVDMADVKKVDLKQVWALWRDKWKVGGLDLQLNRNCRNAAAAVNYAISYCQHQSGAVAEWVKDCQRAPRAYEVYGELRKAISEYENPKSDDTEVVENDAVEIETSVDMETEVEDEVTDIDQYTPMTDRLREKTYVGERLVHCDDKTLVLLKTDYDGHISYDYVSDLEYSTGQIALASKFLYTDVLRKVVETESVTTSVIYMPVESKDDPEILVERIRADLRNMMRELDVEVIPI
jgi:hypothetical protein